MSVSNGNLANATTFNTAFVSRTADDNTTGKKDLQNADAVSGPNVTNVQREINSLNSYSGRTSGSAFDADPAWTNNDVGSVGDSLFTRVNTITGEFDLTTGHNHNGVDGNGGTISAANLSNLNYFRAVRQVAIIDSGTAATKTVTTEFSGKTAGGTSTSIGVVTVSPKNRCYLIQNADGTAPIDPQGDIVYARVTESAGVWTLSFFTLEAGVQTAYSFPSNTQLQVYFTEVFNLSTVPTFNEDAGLVETGNFTADIPDASSTVRGLVSTGSQDFAGTKSFNGAVRLREAIYIESINNASTGTSVTLANPALGIIRLTSGSLVSFDGIAAPPFAQVISVFNATGVQIEIENNNAGTPADGILTGTGANFDFADTAAILLIYDLTTARWRMIGGGGGAATTAGGGSGINYMFENPGAEDDVAGYVTYQDTSAARPEDGVGGAPTVTLTRTTSSPLRGTGSFLFTKDGSNRRGEGFSYALTVDNADLAKVQQISFDYEIASGTYSGGTSSTDSDLIVYVYRTTATARLIEPSVIKLDGGVVGVKYSYRGEFQTDSDATGYRLIVHVATTSASAYTVKFDNFVVGPSKNVNGAIITGSIAYTPTLTTSGGGSITLNATGVVSPAGYWRRNGEFLEGQISFRNGSGGAATGSAGDVRVGLPTGLVPDTAKMAAAPGSVRADGSATTGAATNTEATVIVSASGFVTFYRQGSGTLMQVSDIATNFIVSASFRFPVVGWGATATLGQDADTRVVGFSARAASATVSGAASTVTWGTIESDTHGGFDGVDDYTIRVAGWYRIYSQMRIDGTYAANQVASVYIRVNGSDKVQGQDRAGGVITALYPNVTYQGYFNAGDTVRIMVDSSATTPTINTATTVSWFSITRESGPSQVAATEVIAAKYYQSTAQTIPNASQVVAFFDTKVFDTHNAMRDAGSGLGAFPQPTQCRFVCPAAGIYEAQVSLRTASGGGWTVGEFFEVGIWKNGVVQNYKYENVTAAHNERMHGVVNALISCVAGDIIQAQVRQNSGAGLNYLGEAEVCFFQVKRIGGIG